MTQMEISVRVTPAEDAGVAAKMGTHATHAKMGLSCCWVSPLAVTAVFNVPAAVKSAAMQATPAPPCRLAFIRALVGRHFPLTQARPGSSHPLPLIDVGMRQAAGPPLHGFESRCPAQLMTVVGPQRASSPPPDRPQGRRQQQQRGGQSCCAWGCTGERLSVRVAPEPQVGTALG
jgi:hypothetical protein